MLFSYNLHAGFWLGYMLGSSQSSTRTETKVVQVDVTTKIIEENKALFDKLDYEYLSFGGYDQDKGYAIFYLMDKNFKILYYVISEVSDNYEWKYKAYTDVKKFKVKFKKLKEK
jgi:hypothetical protein